MQQHAVTTTRSISPRKWHNLLDQERRMRAKAGPGATTRVAFVDRHGAHTVLGVPDLVARRGRWTIRWLAIVVESATWRITLTVQRTGWRRYEHELVEEPNPVARPGTTEVPPNAGERRVWQFLTDPRTVAVITIIGMVLAILPFLT